MNTASSLIAPAISLERPDKKDLRKGQYVECKCNARPGDPESPVYSIQIPYFGTGTPEEWLQFLDNLEKAINGQHITSGPERYELTERLLTGDALATFKLKTLEQGNRTVEHFNMVIAQLTAHIFPAHAYREQKCYMRRFLKKPRSYSVREFSSRVQEINQYLPLFPSETEEPARCLPEDELKEVLFHAMPSTWRQEMTKQGFTYPNHTVIDLIQFAERLESLEPAELKKPAEPKKVNAVKMDQIPKKKRKRVNFVPSDTRTNALGYAKGTKNTADFVDQIPTTTRTSVRNCFQSFLEKRNVVPKQVRKIPTIVLRIKTTYTNTRLMLWSKQKSRNSSKKARRKRSKKSTPSMNSLPLN